MGSTQSTHCLHHGTCVCSGCALLLRCPKKWLSLKFNRLCFINKCFREDFDNQTKQNVLIAVSCKVAPKPSPCTFICEEFHVLLKQKGRVEKQEETPQNRRKPHICFENLSYSKHLCCKAIPAFMAQFGHRETEPLRKAVPALLS